MGAEAETMKALTFSKYAGKAPVESVLSVMSVPKPTATPKGFVMVKVVAAALNPIDKLRIKGDIKLLNPEPEFPAVVGYDLSGTIVEVGEEVAGFEVGNEVVARMQSKPMPGSIGAPPVARTLALPSPR
jgi:NADPH:quinone reductase-like Zn-dependent oxidoreductase